VPGFDTVFSQIKFAVHCHALATGKKVAKYLLKKKIAYFLEKIKKLKAFFVVISLFVWYY
jgi:RsiW-degrading membrane proteinase PrsW (M82 family)